MRHCFVNLGCHWCQYGSVSDGKFFDNDFPLMPNYHNSQSDESFIYNDMMRWRTQVDWTYIYRENRSNRSLNQQEQETKEENPSWNQKRKIKSKEEKPSWSQKVRGRVHQKPSKKQVTEKQNKFSYMPKGKCYQKKKEEHCIKGIISLSY